MNTTARTTRTASAIRTTMRTPKRFVLCIACGTWKKERGYALCAECFRTNGKLSRSWFGCFLRHADREGEQWSYRNDPRFEKACRVYGRRRQRRAAQVALDAVLPKVGRGGPQKDRCGPEEYDGLGPYDLGDVLDWQVYGIELPEPERIQHRELSDVEIARWDARVDAWAAAHGLSLKEDPAPEIQPWGFWLEIDGAQVWTDDLVLE